MVDKQDLYERFKAMQQQTEAMNNELTLMQAGITEILEQNAELEIENQHLRELLNNSTVEKTVAADNSGSKLSRSRKNLEKLYEQGFHVCNTFYGQRRLEDESCAFCLDVIYGD